MTKAQHLKGQSFFVQWLILGIALLVMGLLLVQEIYREHVHIEAQERMQLAQQAHVVEQNLVRQLDAINRVLQSTRNDLIEWMPLRDGRERIEQRFTFLTEAMPGVRTMLVLDAEGNALAASRKNLVGQNYRYRDYFQAPLRDPHPDTLYISPPFVTQLGVLTMNISRAIIDADGKFAGVISASLEPGEFAVLMASVRYAPDMWTAMAHGDGKLFMMVPAREGRAGMDLARPGTMFSRHMQSGQAVTLMDDTVYAMGERRLMAQRTVRPEALHMDKPLVVATTRNRSSIFENWYRELYIKSAIFGVLALVSSLGLAFYQRGQREFLRLIGEQEEEQRKSAERLHLATEAAGVGVWEYDLVNQRLIWDDSMFAIYGISPGEFSSDYAAWRSCLLPEDAAKADEAARASIEQSIPYDACFRIRRKDGQIRFIHARARVHYDESGKPQRMVGTNEDITEREQMEARMEYMAHYDSLTGLANRTLFYDRLRQALSMARRNEVGLALLYIDLDGFKEVNDTLGHAAGDLLLKEVAGRLRSCVRQSDSVARLGGDEFTIILNETHQQDDVAAVARKIVEAIAAPVDLEEGEAHVSVSIGIARYTEEASDEDTLVRNADEAMYRAKSSGKNTFRFYSDEQ
ncbi:MAG TPA: diguanylate cyclase [Gallionella sp.]|nr:diguanylate cyclase [Gallionella sp.]